MGWVQLHNCNWIIPYVGGWCEGYVEGAWGQATLPRPDYQKTHGVHKSATAAWNANRGNHPNELPPAGHNVPVFFSLGSTPLGHVAISLDDGYIASSSRAGYHTQGYLHPNLNQIISEYGQYNNGCTYLGWSEWVGNLKVIAWEDWKNERYSEPITFEESTENDNSLPLGEIKIKQKGVNGEHWWVDQIRTLDGAETGRTRIDEGIIPAQPEITLIGTYVAPAPTPEPVPTPEPTPEPVPQPTKSFLRLLLELIIDFIRSIFKK